MVSWTTLEVDVIEVMEETEDEVMEEVDTEVVYVPVHVGEF